MINFVTGNILESNAECLVNTVNCEGYMGKGIAYQFKLKYPDNYQDYVKACRSGALKIGTIHYFKEHDKHIVNFPTKDKWRQKSRIEYIEEGLRQLTELLVKEKFKSIAIPPLGCGNGGLNWSEVEPLVLKYMEPFENQLDIFIYQPSQYYKTKVTKLPSLNASHLIIMMLKPKLKRFNRIRLQKSAYFMNLFSKDKYFKFAKYKYGPYAHSIDVIIKDIREFQEYYNVETIDAIKILKNTLTSESVERKINNYLQAINRTIQFVNSISTDKELELLSTICFIIEERKSININNIIFEFKNWSDEKAIKFSENEIMSGVEKLVNENIIYQDLMGNYSLL